MKITFALFSLFIFSVSAWAEIKLPALFNDGMILQRQQAVPVWGWAPEDTVVIVSFTGQTKETKADKNGKWMLKLDALKANAKSAEMIVKVGSETKVIKNVLVGEVWICSGQSNMDFNMAAISRDPRDPKQHPISQYIAQETKTAKDPLFKQIEVIKSTSPFKEKVEFKGSWKALSPETAPAFTATGYFFGRELRQKLKVPVGLIKCAWGGTRVEPWVPMEKWQTTPSLKEYYDKETTAVKKAIDNYDPTKAKAAYEKRITDIKAKAEKAKAEGKKFRNWRPRKPRSPAEANTIPSTLYNALINPLVPYAVKGAIWYQGESNRKHMPDKYEAHFSAMIEAWRKNWGQDKFYFYWCQLAQFQKANTEPLSKDSWTDVCNQQRLTLKLPNTGMAVLNDIGDAIDIHPRNKVDAGKRLSLWAFKQAYNFDIIASGPLYKSHKIDGNKVVITFDSTGKGLMVGKKDLMDPTVPAGGPLKRFQICGADKVWKWADAKISGKDNVEVSHKDIQIPIEVRYAWSPNPEGANLYNKAGLPTSVFKTSE